MAVGLRPRGLHRGNAQVWVTLRGPPINGSYAAGELHVQSGALCPKCLTASDRSCYLELTPGFSGDSDAIPWCGN